MPDSPVSISLILIPGRQDLSPYQRVPYVASDHAAGHHAHEMDLVPVHSIENDKQLAHSGHESHLLGSAPSAFGTAASVSSAPWSRNEPGRRWGLLLSNSAGACHRSPINRERSTCHGAKMCRFRILVSTNRGKARCILHRLRGLQGALQCRSLPCHGRRRRRD